jgi:AraC-like DNA-binding protein
MSIHKKADGFDSEKILVLSQQQLALMAEHPLINQAYITDIGYYPRAYQHFRERRRGTEAFILIYCVQGTGWLRLGDAERIDVPQHSLLVIPAGVAHSYGADETDPWSIYWFHLKGEQIEDILSQSGLQSGRTQLPPSEAEKLIELFRVCFDLLSTGAYQEPNLLHVSHAARYMLSHLGLAQRLHQEEKAKAYYDQAVLYMQQKLEMNITLDELAEHTRISRQHLNYVFRKATGITPIDYYLRLKMQRACQMLDLTDQTIKEVSLALGFGDPFYFSRLFKKMIGLSPTQYRSQLRG